MSRISQGVSLLVVFCLDGCSSCHNQPPSDPPLIEAKAFLVNGQFSDCPYSTFFGNPNVILNIETSNANGKVVNSTGALNTANSGNNYVVKVPQSGDFTLKAYARGPAPPSCQPCFNQCASSSGPDGEPSFFGEVTVVGPAIAGHTYTIPMDFKECTC